MGSSCFPAIFLFLFFKSLTAELVEGDSPSPRSPLLSTLSDLPITSISPYIITGSSELTKEIMEVAKALVREGFSSCEIGRKTGSSEAAVRRVKKAVPA